MKVYAVYHKGHINKIYFDKFFDTKEEAEAFIKSDDAMDGSYVVEESFAQILNELTQRLDDYEDRINYLEDN